MGSTSPSGLELTMAVPGLSSSSGSEGFGCNNNNGSGNGNNMRDLDMNQPASGGEEEEFPMGSVEEEEDERGGAGGPHRAKKLRLSKEQSRLLEESFRLNHTLTPKQKEALAVKLKLRPRQVEVWFQNRRARTKLKQTELECEYLKRCFGSLTEENRRLQREVEELRAMRVAPPTVLSPHTRQPLPASALTMCPRCERITAATAARTPRPPPAASPFHPRRPSAAF
ncbi:Homeobox-leucine zipper protein ATHB-4 [Zea mays]